MATLVKQQITRAGVVPAFAAVNASDKFDPDDKTYLHVKNGGGGSINVTITTPGDVQGAAIADTVVAVGAGAEKVIGPLPSRLYANDSDDGLATVTYSGQSSVTAGVFTL